VTKGRPRTLAVSFAAALILVTAACIVTDPPNDLPRLPETRPTIVRGSVVPSASSVIGTWPDLFIVPVELSNPRADFVYAAFIDFSPLPPISAQSLESSRYEAANTTGRIRRVQIVLAPPADLDRCHTIEVVVALGFTQNVHTPAEPGGDTVSWFYSPTGDLSGCPVLNPNLDAGQRDGGDAGDGGIQ